MMRTFLPSTLSQPELPSAIQLLGSSNVDLHGMGDSDIVTTPPDLSPRAPDTQGEGVGGSLLVILGQFVSHFVSARISDVSATYQRCISVSALSRS